jgi:hypothetical protein
VWAFIILIVALLCVLSFGWRVGRRWGLAIAIVAIAIVARADLFAVGNLFSSTAVWAADVVTAVLLFLAITLVLARPKDSATADAKGRGSWESRLAATGVAVAVPVGLIGAVQLAYPVTPHPASAPACAGASVAGGTFLATTPSTGINARSGPDTSYPQVSRFGANCTLSFDGYCIGEPTDDLVVKERPDQRWLILHQAWKTWPWRHMWWHHEDYEFVAAGKIQSQTQESVLGSRPDPICSTHGGWKLPKQLTLTTTLTKGVVTAHASALGSELIGVSVLSSRPPENGSSSIRSVTTPTPEPTDASSSITATWKAEAGTGKVVGPHSAIFTLVASACLAPAVPATDNYAVRRFAWDGRTISPLSDNSSNIPYKERLLEEACRVGPDY